VLCKRKAGRSEQHSGQNRQAAVGIVIKPHWADIVGREKEKKDWNLLKGTQGTEETSILAFPVRENSGGEVKIGK